MARITKAEKIASTPISDIGKLSGDTGLKKLRDYIRTLRTGYTRRVSSFKRAGLISYAQLAFEAQADTSSKNRKINELSRNQLIAEFARYSKFFNDATSTKAGIKRVNKEQDIRLFGADRRGRPKRTMTSAERLAYWELYDHYINSNLADSVRWGSTRLQQVVAEVFKDNPADNKILLSALIKERLEDFEDESIPNVQLGRRNYFK